MNTRELLEKDRERLKGRLSAAGGPEEAAVICEDEINRVLMQYNEQAPSDVIRRAASAFLTTVRYALPLIDSSGEIQTYERTLPKEKKNAAGWAALAIGAGFSAAAAFFLMTATAAMSPVGLVLLAAGLVGIFIGGLKFGRNRGAAPRVEQIIEVHPDPDKIYRNLTGYLTAVDRCLEDVQIDELRDKEQAAPEVSGRMALPEDELQLLSGILEAAYARGDSPDAQSVISNIRFYLHKKGIEVIEYSEENARYFNKMPSRVQGTLRPAILQDNTVIVKGLTGGGM